MQHGSRDFVSGTPMDLNHYFNNAVDIHHVFPRAWCTKRNIEKEKWNSVVNKAPLAASTNRFIGGTAPSAYLERIRKTKKSAIRPWMIFFCPMPSQPIRCGMTALTVFSACARQRCSI